MERISRNEMFLHIARTVALRGTCPRAQVGAVIVRDKRIISIGYNGAPPGMPECDQVQCEEGPDGGCERTIHAEANAILWAGRAGIPLDETSMYSTHAPCYHCAKMMIGAGIGELLYILPYRDTRGIELLNEAHVVLHKLQD